MTEFRKNSNIVFLCQYHVVWCTKYRTTVLKDDIATLLETLIREKAMQCNVNIIALEIMNDHVHLLCDVDPQFGICKFLKLLKGYTSKLLRDRFISLKALPALWTNSYFVTTVSNLDKHTIKRYIESQKEA